VGPDIRLQQTDDDEEYEEQSDCQDIRGLMRVRKKGAAQPAGSTGASAPIRPSGRTGAPGSEVKRGALMQRELRR
jgi:hypothetical protein